MTPEADLLRLLASMPFLDRLEAVAISGWSRGAVYGAIRTLEKDGLVAALPHASELIAPTRRYYLTSAGLGRLAAEEGVSLDDLLRSRPVSAHWQRILLERLDPVASTYRLASAIADIAFPIRFRWYRATPMDAAIALPDGRTLFVIRQGHTSDRTAFSKRLWRLRQGPTPGAFLLLLPDEVRLRRARSLMTGAPAMTFLALERDAVTQRFEARVWHTPPGAHPLDLREVLSHAGPGRAWPAEPPLVRAVLPQVLPEVGRRDAPPWLLPPLLRSAEKRVLDLLSDWPWMAPRHLAGLLDVSISRASQLVRTLVEAGLVTRVGGHLSLSDRGLALLARRDRAAVGLARRRWSPALLDPDPPPEWRNVAGRRSRQLFRNLEHTTAVHEFVSALATQAREQGWEVVKLDPPHRASRYFRYNDRLHSVHPDAFGIVRRDGETRAFFLEWERRAVRPTTMAARLAPYLRYYASRHPTDDHGVRPAVLVVFDDDLAKSHFLSTSRAAMDHVGVEVPLRVSAMTQLAAEGPLQQVSLGSSGS